MAVFHFTLNRSFLGTKVHPITVPKSQVPYRAFEAEGLSAKDITIIFPRGEQFEGQMYHGDAGYGEYYQIRFCGENRTIPGYLKLDDQLLVTLHKVSGRNYAVLEYRE